MTPEQTLIRPKLKYAIFGAIFGLCFPIIILIQNFPVSLLNPQKAPDLIKGYFIIFIAYLIWNIWCLLAGALVGMLIGLAVERWTKKRTVNPIVTAGIGGLIWSIVMAILGLSIPLVLAIIVFSLIGQNAFISVLMVAFGVFALIGGIVLLIPFSIISFMLAATISRRMPNRFQMNTYHLFPVAGCIAAIFCFIALILKIIGNIF